MTYKKRRLKIPKKISKRMKVVAGLAVIIVGGYVGYGAIFQHHYNSPTSTSSTSEYLTLAGRTVSGTLFCSVEGMYCSGCEYSVQSALTRVEGVESVWVDSRPGKPVDNAYIESFNGRVRQECLNLHWFTEMDEVRSTLEIWKMEYNMIRPHSSLGYLSPVEYASSYREKRKPVNALKSLEIV